MPGRTALRTEIPRLTPKPVFSGRRGEKTKSFAVISSHSNDGMMRFPRGQRVGGLQAIRWSGFWASSIAVIVVLTGLALLPSFGAGAVPSGPNPPLGVHLRYLDD